MRSLNIKPTILELNQYYEKNKKEGFFKIIFNYNTFKLNWFLILLQIFKNEDGQIDFADFTASGAVNDGYRCCFVAIAFCTKCCHAVPIKDKKPAESVRAMKDGTEVGMLLGIVDGLGEL